MMATGKYEYWTTPEGLALLEGWARDGLIDEEIAGKIGIARTTLYAWMKKYSDISNALKKGKEVVDYQVEKILFKKAMDGDVTAIIFWLKNRRPDKWRDRRNMEVSGSLASEQSKLQGIMDQVGVDDNGGVDPITKV